MLDKNQYKSIFLSDMHLGSKRSNAKAILNFLKHNTADNFYLLGDIIDGWKIQRNKFEFNQDQLNVVKKLLTLAKKKKVVYIVGNHDEFLKVLLPFSNEVGNIKVYDHFNYIDSFDREYLLTHGDMFDGIQHVNKYLCILGDSSYDVALALNSKLNWFLRKFKIRYWSFSRFAKSKVKKVMAFMYEFEKNITEYCKRKDYDGVICGHIHQAQIKEINGITYMNTGDWVESCTALAETLDGHWKIIEWGKNENFNSI